MAEIVPLLDRRAIPMIGADVHVYDLGSVGFVLRFQNSQIVEQSPFANFRDALEHARQLADRLGCAMIEH